MNDPLTPATVAALAIAERWPNLTKLAAQAAALVDTGCVYQDTTYSDIYYVRVSPSWSETVIIQPKNYSCYCPSYHNGIAGWWTPYPPVVELNPGIRQIICPHVLAVHIHLMIEAQPEDYEMFLSVRHAAGE